MQIPVRRVSAGVVLATFPARAATANGDVFVNIERPPMLGVPYAAVSEALQAGIAERVRGSVPHKNKARGMRLVARCLL